MKKSLTFWNSLPVLLIISGALLLISQILIKRKRAETSQPPDEEAEAEVVEDEEPLTKEARVINNYKAIRDALPANVKDEFAKLLTAQAMHETGVFTSRLYLEQNNLYGMTQPTIRETISTGGVNGWANYASLEDSTKDLLLYFKEFNMNPADKAFLDPERNKGVNTYLKAIKANGYFEAPYMDYYNAVKKHLSTVKNLIQ